MHEQKKIAVFDLDGTITHRDTYIHFLSYCMLSKPIRLLKAPLLVVYFVVYKSGIRSNHWLKARFLRSVIGGIAQKELDQLSSQFCKLTLRKNIKSKAMIEIEKLREEGYLIVLATASFGFYVRKLAGELAVDELLCSEAEVDQSGCLTGQLEGLNCIGEEKAHRLRLLQEERGWQKINSAYSDDKVDLPLLTMAATAYVVDPGPATRLVAGQYGLRVLNWK